MTDRMQTIVFAALFAVSVALGGAAAWTGLQEHLPAMEFFADYMLIVAVVPFLIGVFGSVAIIARRAARRGEQQAGVENGEDRRRAWRRFERAGGVYHVGVFGLLITLQALFVLMKLEAIDASRIAPGVFIRALFVAIGVLLAVFGNALPRRPYAPNAAQTGAATAPPMRMSAAHYHKIARFNGLVLAAWGVVTVGASLLLPVPTMLLTFMAVTVTAGALLIIRVVALSATLVAKRTDKHRRARPACSIAISAGRSTFTGEDLSFIAKCAKERTSYARITSVRRAKRALCDGVSSSRSPRRGRRKGSRP
jgi:hypothetical protein